MLPGPIALDATLWDEPTTGIGLYARCLYQGLIRRGVEVERLGARHSGEAPRRLAGRSAYVLGELPAALGRSRAPLFHGVSNFNLPLTRVAGKKLVLTVHDLIPDLLPDTVSRAFKWQFRLWLHRSLQVADLVVCVSQTTRADLLRRFELDEARVKVVHNGVDHVDHVPALDPTGLRYLDALALPEQYVLYAGSLDGRKNVALVLDAMERLWRSGRKLTLVLAGQSWFGAGPVQKRVGRLRADGFDLRPLGYLSDPLFYEVMRRATVFTFPSHYEGFGLPPLEAMRLGVPTIVSDTGSLPEVCADGALYVSPHDAGALADAIVRVCEQPQLRARLASAGRARAGDFTWDAAASRMVELYGSVLEA
jgi:glycosyltransferase involved in cell wall biosynthesis